MKKKENKNSKLLFSLDAKEFKWDYFSTGGPGGQNQNRKLNGVRCTHEPSKAVGTARELKSQAQNKEAAFTRCCESKEFQLWCKLEASRRLGNRSVDEIVDDMMEMPSDFKIEVKDSEGKWIEISLEGFLTSAS